MKRPLLPSFLASFVFLVAAVIGCSGGGGGGDDDDDDDDDDDKDKVTEVAEEEPNDGPDASGAQDIGALPAAGKIVIEGELSSGGNDAMKYTGDFDLFAIEVSEPGAIDVTVEWSDEADVDLGVYDAELNQVTGEGAQAYPIESSLAYADGKYIVALFSKDNPTPYKVTITYKEAEEGGECPTTPVRPAAPSGGCTMSLVTPVCSMADLTGGKVFELAWSTNMTFCEGPHTLYIAGDPPSSWETGNVVEFSIASTVGPNNRQGMTRNIGGYLNINSADLVGLTSSTGIYYYLVASYHGSASESRAFRVVK